jgi:peroxiredoxin
MRETQQNMAVTVPRKAIPLILLGLGLILMALSAYLIMAARPSQTDLSAVPVKVSFPAPDLTLNDTQGVSHSLADYRGQVVLVNLWATWCPPCKEEMPTLQAFYNKHKENGFVIIAVNDGDPTADVLQFVKDYRLTFPVWLDPTYIATEKAFHTLNLPTSFVIDRDGTIRLTWVGGIDAEMLDKHVTPLIMEQ